MVLSLHFGGWGFALGVLGVVLAFCGDRWVGDGAAQAAPLLPLVGALLVGLLYPETQGWPRRLLCSGLGFVGTTILGGALILLLMRYTEWFSIGDTHGHLVMVILLVLLVGIAGAVAATPAHFFRGFSLSLAFFWGLMLVLVIYFLVTGEVNRLSTIQPWAIVTIVGAALGASVGHLLGMK